MRSTKSVILFLIVASFFISISCSKKPQTNAKLPSVELKELNGHTVNLADFRGKPILVNFWATWCGPCRIEIPMLNELHRKYGRDLVIVGISTDDEGAEAVREFNKEVPIEYRSLVKTAAVEQTFGGIWALPTSIFYDKEGNQVEKIIGLQTRDFFEKTIQETIKRK
jgi:thiol-disulfide isomerase/thioredoxin